MAATLAWENSTQASTPSWSTVTKLRFKAANDNTDDLNDPLVKPSSGTNYSFEKWCRINVTDATGVTQLSNLRVLLSTHPVHTGITVNYGFTSTYATPVGTDSSEATTELTDSEVSWDNAGTTSSTGAWGDMVVLQMDLSTSAVGGEISDFNLIAR